MVGWWRRFDNSAIGAHGSADPPKTWSWKMKIVASVSLAACLLSGCISSSSPPPPPEKTTVVVPRDSGTVVVCQNGSKPPCN